MQPEQSGGVDSLRFTRRPLTGVDQSGVVSRLSPLGHDDGMTDAYDLAADELDQLTQSLAIDGLLGRADTLRVVEVLRALAKTLRGA